MHKFLVYLSVHWNICWSITTNENERKKVETAPWTKKKNIFLIKTDYHIWMQKKKNKKKLQLKRKRKKKLFLFIFSLLFSSVSMRTFYISNGEIPWNEFWIKCILMQMTLYTKHFNNETQYHSIYHKHGTSYILTTKRSHTTRLSHTSSCIHVVFGLVHFFFFFAFWFAIRIY